LADTFTGSIRTQAHEKFRRKGSVGKATKFKFGRFIRSVHANKSPLKFGRKGSVGVSRDCTAEINIFGIPYYFRDG